MVDLREAERRVDALRRCTRIDDEIKQRELGAVWRRRPLHSPSSPRSHSRRSVKDEGAAGLGLPAVLAVPNPDSLALDAELPAEIAEVLGVLAGVGLLDLLTQRSTVTGAVLPDDTRLLRALGLRK